MKLPVRPGLIISFGFAGLLISGIWLLMLTENFGGLFRCVTQQSSCGIKTLNTIKNNIFLIEASLLLLIFGLSLPQVGSINVRYAFRFLKWKSFWAVFLIIILPSFSWGIYINECPVVRIDSSLATALDLEKPMPNICTLSQFTDLDLSNQNIRLSNVFQYFSSLSTLNLNNTELGTVWYKTLEAPKLKELYLNHNISHRIPTIKPHEYLEMLSLTHNRIVRIENVANLQNLRELHLEYNQIENLKAWVDRMVLKELEHPLYVYLEGNPLSEQTLEEDVPRLPENVILVY